jgi:1-deoxy-D-xylulose 5-phosphate reductoisomerase
VCVEAFLQDKISFAALVPVVEEALAQDFLGQADCVESILGLDTEVRQWTTGYIESRGARMARA